MKRKYKIVMGIVIAAIIIGSVVTYTFMRAPPAEKKMVMVADYKEVSRHLDPVLAEVSSDQSILYQVYDPLIKFNGSMPWEEPIPWTAKSWSVSDDGLTYTFHLRDGVTYRNGDEVVAKDICWMLYRMHAGWYAYPSSPTAPFNEHVRGGLTFKNLSLEGKPVEGLKELLRAEPYEVVDEDTLKIHMAHRFAPLKALLTSTYAGVAMNPDYFWSKTTGWLKPVEDGGINGFEVIERTIGDILPLADTGEACMGTGPYYVSNWIPQQKIVLEKNPNWWGGPPEAKINRKVDIFVRRYVPEYEVRKQHLATGDCHISYVPLPMTFDYIKEDPWLDERKIEVIPEVDEYATIHAAPSPVIRNVMLQHNKTIYIPEADKRIVNPVRLLEFRKALTYAYPYEEHRQLLNNFAMPADSAMIPRGMLGYFGDDPDVKDVAITHQNLEKAAEIIYELHQEHPFTEDNSTLYFASPDSATYLEGAVAMSEMFPDLNGQLDSMYPDHTIPKFEMKVWPMTYAEVVDRCMSKTVNLAYRGSVPDYWDVHDQIMLYTVGAFGPPMSIYDDKLIQWTHDQAATTDPNERADIIKKIIIRSYEQYHWIFTNQDMMFVVHRDELKNWTYQPNTESLSYIARLYIAE